jgi:glyceraldehyde-3-phosphate dehydrogenase (NADP+)
MQTFCFINGKYYSQASGPELIVTNKYSGHLLASIPQISEIDIDLLMASSLHGFKQLQNFSPASRIDLLEKIFSLLEKEQNHFSMLICEEAGKPISYAKQELKRCLETIRAGIREVGNANGEVVPMLNDDKISFTRRFATGPVLGITPFNFPLNLALHKIIPALAVGASIVVKASPQAPVSLLHLAGLINEAGAPEGAVNCIVCEVALAEKLVRDDRFTVLSFTGSDQVGWYLKSIAGKKKVLLELGGNAPAIVDETANLADAAKKIAYGAFLYAGQTCISTQKIFVSESVAEHFKDLLLSETARIKTGDPQDELVINGPMIDVMALNKTRTRLDEALRSGAQILAGGSVIDRDARLMAPTILSEVNPSLALQREEAFAPIAILETVRNTEHAIKLANSSRFGLQCGVFCNNTEVFKTAFNELQYGAVLLNSAPGFRVDNMPYGGLKDSGQGREGVRYAMLEYTEPKLAVL